ncbi:hypothetical protein CNR22_07925 [Sphingobacteriaceae bacterium]|nr:hypothetical protein CNR22_07925 [Sphingobacteriaceae bacterium]
MEKHRFKLGPKDKRPFEVELKNTENEKHVLIRLSDGAFCDTLNISLLSESETKEEVIEATTFRQFDLQNYINFSLSGNFAEAKGFVEGDVYIGNWEEIVLNEIELSFSDAPFYYKCDLEKIDFTVGAEDQSQMRAEALEDGFSVTSTIIDHTKKIVTVQRTFSDTSDGAQIIKRLYGRLKGRSKGVGFDERQEGQKAKLTEQFNKTLSESFRQK